MNLSGIERYVAVYSKQDWEDGPIEKHSIDIEIDEIEELIGMPEEDDEGYFESYLLNGSQLAVLIDKFGLDIVPNFKFEGYMLETAGVFDFDED